MSQTPSVRFLLAALAVVSLAACSVGTGGSTRIGSPPYEEGSGKVATVVRPLGAFHGVAAAQGLAVSVRTGTAASASVTADENLVGHVVTEVRDGILHVEVTGSIETHNPLRVDVTAAASLDTISADAGSSVDMEDIAADTLSVHAGSGSTVRGGGRASSVDLAADTGSTADLRNVEVADATIRVTSGSTGYIHASGTVRGSCIVGSTLHVGGQPQTVDVQVDAGSTLSRD